MAEYKTVVDWKDLEDNDYIYYKGDPYPREGLEVSGERKAELASENNKRNEILIKKIEKEDYPKHVGGGYYELSNGEKVQGKDAAIEAEEALKEGDQ